MSKLVPAGDYVLVLDIQRETDIGGIVMPDNERQQEMAFGKVVATGPTVSGYTEAGNTVFYGPYAGKNVVMEGVQFRLIHEEQIEGHVRD